MEVIRKCFFYATFSVMTFNMLFYGALAENAVAELYYVKDADVRFTVNHIKIEAPTILKCSRLCQGDEVCKSFYFMSLNRTCILNHDLPANLPYSLMSDTKITVQYGVLRKIFGIFKDCEELYAAGHRLNGVYNINPSGIDNVAVQCDMDRLGLTVFQNRMDDSEDFCRNWKEYENGFGYPFREHWIGLRYITLLTQNLTTLFIEMKANVRSSPTSDIACNGSFQLANAHDFYKLTVGTFLTEYTSVGVYIYIRNKVNDLPPNIMCHIRFHGGLMYVGGSWHNCTQAILNGNYHCIPGSLTEDECMYWVNEWKFNSTLEFITMIMRRY